MACRCRPPVAPLLLPIVLLGMPGGFAQAACNAQASLAASGRVEKERCLLQYGAPKLSLNGQHGVVADDSESLADPASRSHVGSSRSEKFGHTAIGLIESRMARLDSGATAASDIPKVPQALAQEHVGSDPHGGGAHGGGESHAPETEEVIPATIEAGPTEDGAVGQVEPVQLEPTATGNAAPKYSLMMEVHIPIRLRELHSGTYGPLPKLVKDLQEQMQAAAEVPASRLLVLDIRGEYMTLDLKQLELLAMNDSHVTSLLEHVPDPEMSPTEGALAEAFDCEAGNEMWESGWSQTKKAWCCRNEQVGCPKETIVDIEVLPGSSSAEPTPASIMTTWARQVADEQSTLRKGPLAPLFQSVTLVTQGSPAAPAEAVSAKVAEAPPEPEEKSSALAMATSLSSFCAAVFAFVL